MSCRWTPETQPVTVLKIREGMRRRSGSRRLVFQPETRSKPSSSLASRRGISAGSSWRSPSIVTITSPFAWANPAASAAALPKFRRSRTTIDVVLLRRAGGSARRPCRRSSRRRRRSPPRLTPSSAGAPSRARRRGARRSAPRCARARRRRSRARAYPGTAIVVVSWPSSSPWRRWSRWWEAGSCRSSWPPWSVGGAVVDAGSSSWGAWAVPSWWSQRSWSPEWSWRAVLVAVVAGSVAGEAASVVAGSVVAGRVGRVVEPVLVEDGLAGDPFPRVIAVARAIPPAAIAATASPISQRRRRDGGGGGTATFVIAVAVGRSELGEPGPPVAWPVARALCQRRSGDALEARRRVGPELGHRRRTAGRGASPRSPVRPATRTGAAR